MMATSPMSQGAPENGMKINTTVTLSGDAVEPAVTEQPTSPAQINEHDTSVDPSRHSSKTASRKGVPELPVT